jgi:transketolase
MSSYEASAIAGQTERNKNLIGQSQYMRDRVESQVLPLRLNPRGEITGEQLAQLQALEIEAARISIASLASLATIGELDHLGGGLDLIPGLMMTLAMTDYQKVEFTIEHAHTSIGYYSSLSALGFLEREVVVDEFRRGLDIAGHVSWVPGGTQLNGGRLGVMVPVATGQALGMRARDAESWVVCHCGDAGWISGQALNGFNGADLHDAPLTFVMHRNGIQLSDSNKNVMDKDPRPIVEAMGVEVLEISALYETAELFKAYQAAHAKAMAGRPVMIYPKGVKQSLDWLGSRFGIREVVEQLAGEHGIALDRELWIPGSLMSYRDPIPMIECVLLVNDLPGGEGHHDGHMKGRDEAVVLANPMLQRDEAQQSAFDALQSAEKVTVVTEARPAPGTANLVLSAEAIAEVELPEVGKKTSARAGSQEAYAAVAKQFPNDVFVVSCDLDPSTKLGKARGFLADNQQFEMSIEEQASALLADGLAMSSRQPQLNIVSTFAAFYEGIAREGLELWRYQRNLNGVNEGLNVTMHLSHVGACTGRDHFSGWSLDWISLAMGYLPYLDRFYAPADARAAFVAVKDAAARYGGHIVAIPRDSLPILADADGNALWNADSEWEAATPLVKTAGAQHAILAMGAPVYLGGEAAEQLTADGTPTDVYVVNGLPLPDDFLPGVFAQYSGGVVTIEDGIIATRAAGLRGFASLVSSAAAGTGTPTEHVGIVDPRVAPSEGHAEVWEHFGLTTDALVAAVQNLQ